MSPSSPTKTSWSSGSRKRASRVEPALVELRDVSLRFVSYHDKGYSFKRAALDLLLRREASEVETGFWALRDVSLRIEHGERVGIIGHNGAGKSTLLRLLARIYPPTGGTLRVNGSVAPLIEMGAGFNPELSGLENIYLNGAMLGFNRRAMEARVEGILDWTGLREFADLPLKYYSSGMYVRLAFAIATEIDPEILLIDEALNAGDASFVDKAKARIRGLLDRSHAVVVVSHDLDSLREICNRGIWMKQGRVAADGPIDEVVDRYLSEARASAVLAAPEDVSPPALAPVVPPPQDSRAVLLARVNDYTWAHTIDLGGGVETPGVWGKENHLQLLSVFDDIDFRGKKVLDVGCWDGLWSFEAERRGAAEVYATDDLRQREFGHQPTFLLAAQLRGSQARFFGDVSPMDVGRLHVPDFDVVIFASMYLRLKDPLLALARLRRVMKDGALLCVEGVVRNDDGCHAEFFYDRYFAGDRTIWWLPTITCLRAWVKSSAFEIEREYPGYTTPEGYARYIITARASRRPDPHYFGVDDELHAYQAHPA